MSLLPLFGEMSRIKFNLFTIWSDFNLNFTLSLFRIFHCYRVRYVVFHYYCKIVSCRGNFDLQGLKRELENEFEE